MIPKSRTNQDAGAQGQAMVEFVIILIFIMAMCAGMLASMRLLTFQFWAQQEARYIAWEQTWAPHDFYGDPENDPISKLDDGAFFGRPEVVSNRDKKKNVSDDQGLPALLSWLKPAAEEETGLNATIGESESSAVLLAKADSIPRHEKPSIWSEKSSDWLKPGGGIERALSFVQTAFASQDVERSVRDDGYAPNDSPDTPRGDSGVAFPDLIAPKLKAFFELAGVGPQVCGELQSYAQAHGQPAFFHPLAGSDCAQKVEEGLANTIAENTDIKDFFRGYEENIQSGFSAPDALEISVREEVATQFYSFFDSAISIARAGAVPALVVGNVEAALSLADSTTARYISDMRYLGSIAAVSAISIAVGSLAASNPSNQDAAAAKSVEDSIVAMLHVDADVALGSPFFLSPVYLPVPPTFGAVAGGLQDSIMKNLLSQSEDSALRDEQIENSNKLVQVTYKAQGGLFQLAKKIKNIENAELSARYYLVTQPWHLTRRKDKTGDYREKGTQFDPKSDETEEAVMRRRVLGLWLFPSDPVALVEPISLLPGLGFLAPVFTAFEPLGSVISTIKGFVTDNPLFDIAQALSEIPVIGDIIPVPPVWPAVRPDAYPGSTEMTGNDPDKPDKLMHNETRNFSDYVTEQRDNDPDPSPSFN
ncbi:MAG: hypothetical protein U0136_08410 [Bdellovibrionota bacterium]